MHQQGQGNEHACEHACAIAIKISSDKIRFTAYGVNSWVLMDKTLGQEWTRCVEIGQSQKNRSNTTSRKQPQESSRKVKSHKIVTQQKSSQKYPLMRMNRHRSTCETHGRTDGRHHG